MVYRVVLYTKFDFKLSGLCLSEIWHFNLIKMWKGSKTPLLSFGLFRFV